MATYNLTITYGAITVNGMGWNLTIAMRAARMKLYRLELPEPVIESICKLVHKLYYAKRMATPGWMSLSFHDDTAMDDRISIRLAR